MLGFIKKNLKVILVLLLIPIIFIGILEYFSKEITVDGWLGFLGGYLGVLGAVGAIWYQKKLDNETAIKSMELYSDYIAKNAFNKLEENYKSLLSTFVTLYDYGEPYHLRNFDKLKREFDIIDLNFINSNLTLILSNNKFCILLNLKNNLDDIKCCINQLEQDEIKGEIYMPLVSILNKFYIENLISSKEDSISKLRKELDSLECILFTLNWKLNTPYIPVEIDDKKIISKYNFLIQDIIKTFNNKNRTNQDILKCYQRYLKNLSNVILRIVIKEEIPQLKFFNYVSNVSNLVNIMLKIYEDVEKLKSTKK